MPTATVVIRTAGGSRCTPLGRISAIRVLNFIVIPFDGRQLRVVTKFTENKRKRRGSGASRTVAGPESRETNMAV